MNDLNKLFKKKLSEQQFDGKEKYWSQLEKKLSDNEQDKVAIVWYKKWLLPIVAIVVLSTIALLFNYSSKNNVENTKALYSGNSNDQLLPAQQPDHVASTAKKESTTVSTVSNNQITDDATETENDKGKGKVKNDIALNANKAQTASTKSSINSNKNNFKSEKNKPFSATNSKLLKNKNATAAIQIPKEPVLSNSNLDERYYALESNTLNPTFQKNANNTTVNNITQNTADSYALAAALKVNKTLDFSQIEMPLAFLSPKALTAIIYNQTNVNLASNVFPTTTKKQKNNLRLSVYSGAMLSINNLLTTNGNSIDYLNRRKKEEGYSVKPNVGIDIELKRGHWTLTSGINLHQQGEKRNYSNQFKRLIPYDSLVVNINNNSTWLLDTSMFYAMQYNNIVISYDSTVTYYDETSGQFYTAQLPIYTTQTTVVDTNFYYLIDSTYYQSIDTIKTNYALKKQMVISNPNQANLKGRNTFSYVEVPVLIGYEWGIKRWRMSVKGGIGFGILTRQQSFYLTTDEAEIAPVSTAVYSKVMYNGIFRVGMHYSFTPQFGIDFVPFMRLNINNMTNKNATFQQKYTNVGLQVGMNYKL
jgi:hypothetical protein